MEVAAEGGVRGRIRAEDEAATTAKRRKLEEEVDGESRIVSSPCVEFTNGGGIMPRDSYEPPETSVVVVGRTSSDEDQCRSPSSGQELGGASISCCSSSGSCDKVDGRNEFQDLERSGDAEAGMSTHYCCNTGSGISLCCDREEESAVMDSTAAEVKACDVAESRRRNTADNSDMTVTEAELEEFFTAAEKDLGIKIFECSTKYNFDFVKEEPLDGRYEWIRLKP